MAREIRELHPTLQSLLPVLQKEFQKAGLGVKWTDCVRNKAEQDKLYCQGRTAPGNIVTNCKYPQSPHNWGVAVDFCRNEKGKGSYDDSDGFFKKVGTVAKRYGLNWGGDWTGFVDKPHLELTEFMPNSSPTYLIKKYGNPDVFKNTWLVVGSTVRPNFDFKIDSFINIGGKQYANISTSNNKCKMRCQLKNLMKR